MPFSRPQEARKGAETEAEPRMLRLMAEELTDVEPVRMTEPLVVGVYDHQRERRGSEPQELVGLTCPAVSPGSKDIEVMSTVAEKLVEGASGAMTLALAMSSPGPPNPTVKVAETLPRAEATLS